MFEEFILETKKVIIDHPKALKKYFTLKDKFKYSNFLLAVIFCLLYYFALGPFTILFLWVYLLCTGN